MMIGKKNSLRELRESLDLTQEDVAKKIGTTPQNIYKLETGIRKFSPAWIYKICKALDCQPHQLLPDFLDLYTPRQVELLKKLDKLDKQEKEITKEIKEL